MVAEVIGPEFKPQHHNQNKTKVEVEGDGVRTAT
jgi:hypothetical protein